MRRYAAGALGLFAVLAILHTWPLARFADTRVIDEHDGVINAWLLSAVARQVVADPRHPFDINAYYPYPGALAAFDHQLSAVPIVAPLTLARGPLFAANVFVIVSFALAGLFTAVLVRYLTGSGAAGLVAGCVFAFSPVRLENMAQTHVLGSFWLPLALYAVHRYVRRPAWATLAFAAVAYLLLALASWYYAIIGAIGVLVVAVGELAAGGESRGRALRRAAIASVPVVLLLGAVARPYASIAQRFVPWLPHASDARIAEAADEGPAIDRTMKTSVMQALSAPVESYAAPAAASRMPWTPRLSRYGQTGARFFPGVVAVVLAAIAIVVVARSQLAAARTGWIAVALCAIVAFAVASAAAGWTASPLVGITRIPGFFAVLLASVTMWLIVGPRGIDVPGRTYVVLGGVGVLLSFGLIVTAFGVPLGSGVYPATVPPFNMLRAPARVGILTTMAAAVLAGIGYAIVSRRVRHPALQTALAVSAVALVNLELFAPPRDLPRVGRPPEAYTWLNAAPPGAVLELPLHHNGFSLFWSLFHGKPAVNGYGLVEPAAYHRLKGPDDVSPEMLEHARAYFHPRYLIVNRALYAPERLPAVDANLSQAAGNLTRLATFGPRTIYEVTGPSRGSIVLRSYPAWMARGKRTISTHVRLDGAAPRGIPIVQVYGNGQLLASGEPDTTVVASLPADIARGLEVEVMADYALPPGSGAPIGRTARASPADIAVQVGPERTRIQVNGHVWIGRKGYTLVVVEPDGRVSEARGFNTSWSEAESQALAAFVRGLAPDRVVVAATTFDASRSLTADAVTALQSLGITGDLRGKYQWAHAAIGVTGAKPGTAAESMGESSASCAIGSPVRLAVVVEEPRIQ